MIAAPPRGDCAGGEKEVYLYFAYGFPSKDGDLFVQFEGDAALEK